MPKREDERWRNINPHPPGCNCADCTAKRRQTTSGGAALLRCPNCKERSLFFNSHTELWECLNTKCRRRYAKHELAYQEPVSPEAVELRRARAEKVYKVRRNRARWLLALSGVVLLAGSIVYFPAFVEFLYRLGVKNRSFLSSIELPLEVFAAFLVLLALFSRRWATAVKVSTIFLVLVLSALFVWHTPNLKSQASDIVTSWRQRLAPTKQKTTPTASPNVTLTPTYTLTATPFPASALTPAPTRTTVPTLMPIAASTPTTTLLRGYQIENAIFTYTNAERNKLGLKPLILDTALSNIAREHSKDMAQNGYFSHTNALGEGPTERAKRVSYPLHKDLGGGWYSEGIAENIGKMPTGNVVGIGFVGDDADSIAKAQVKSWMDSPGHRANILDTTYDRIGIGTYYDGTLYYLSTQDFW